MMTFWKSSWCLAFYNILIKGQGYRKWQARRQSFRLSRVANCDAFIVMGETNWVSNKLSKLVCLLVFVCAEQDQQEPDTLNNPIVEVYDNPNFSEILLLNHIIKSKEILLVHILILRWGLHKNGSHTYMVPFLVA